MKKFVICAITIAAILPSLCAGIDTDNNIKRDRRAAMIDECFKAYCKRSGINYAAMSAKERDAFIADCWGETDEYLNTIDSIDSVLSIATQINKDM